MTKSDPTSQSNYFQIATKHIHFEWHVDFQRKIVTGSATHNLTIKKNSVAQVIFDTADLVVESVEVQEQAVSYAMKAKHEVLGSALHIPLPRDLKSGTSIAVKVNYHTTKDCIALQWLEKEQTQGKTFPYLFSQCQPIYARALAPLQDTPAVKITYSAEVTSILPVLLSAIRRSPPSDGPPHDNKIIGSDVVTYIYEQPVPIPSYLIAIACGNVRYRQFPKVEGKDWTCGVWAEPELIDACYWEFSEDTSRFLAAEENIVIPYNFGVYDLLVLPPSFPYGGMENACLSFLTPSLLSGDRSLTSVVVHELTHSWFGNGVTAATSHFWLNEGWTTYMERLMQQFLYSSAHRDFAYLNGAKSLSDSLKSFEDRPKYQRLVTDFESGENPQDAYSRVPYEKGANFLLFLERTLGGLEVFLPYIRDYVNTYIGQSITTDEWKSHLYGYFTKIGSSKVKALNSVDWNAWLHGEGIELPVKMEYDVTLAEEVYTLATRWDQSRQITDLSQLEFKVTDLKEFSSNQIIAFLDRLQAYKPLPSPHISYLGELYCVSISQNAEIRLRFYEVAMSDPSSVAAKSYAPEAAKWVVGDDGTGVLKGRMKFCRPIFKAVREVDEELAVAVFLQFKDNFHPIARERIEKDLGITSP